MSFADELNHVTRTESQAIADKNAKEYERGQSAAWSDYYNVKEKLKQMAHDGKYELYNGKKKICLYYYEGRIGIVDDFKLNSCFVTINKTFFNPGGECADKLYYTLINPFHYQGYMDEITRLAAEDDIKIRAVGYYEDRLKTKVGTVEGVMIDFGLLGSEYHVALECIVVY